MDEVQGDAVFESFPGDSFRFGVGNVDGVGKIWLESQASKKCWTCEVTDVAKFAPADVVLPQKTVLHYVAASLKESAAVSNGANPGPTLVREDEDKTLQLEVLIKLGMADLDWAPKYIFPLTLDPQELPPPEVQTQQIMLLTAQVHELQQEVKTLKKQMQNVLHAQAATHPAPAGAAQPSASSPGSPASQTSRHSPAPAADRAVVVVETRPTVSTSSRGEDQVWGDIIGHPQHKLVQTDEYRETRNPLGVTVRSHRQHTCKVCSVLRGNRKRASLSSYYCPECTERYHGGMVFLCDKARSHDSNDYRSATCSQIWHLMWNNGENIPQTGTSAIRMRKRLKTSENETNPVGVKARPSRAARR